MMTTSVPRISVPPIRRSKRRADCTYCVPRRAQLWRNEAEEDPYGDE